MRDDCTAAQAASAPSPASHTYRTVVESDDPHFVEYKTTGVAIFDLIRAVCDRGFISHLPPLSAHVLLLLMNRINGDVLRQTGRLLSWPPRTYLASNCGRSSGQVTRALSALEACKLLRRFTQRGTRYYELLLPEGAAEDDLSLSVCGRASRRSRCAPARIRPRSGCAPARISKSSRCAPARIADARWRASAPRIPYYLKLEIKQQQQEESMRAGAHQLSPGAAAAVVRCATYKKRLMQPDIGFDDDAAAKLAAHPNCNAAQIAIALELAGKRKLRNRLGFIRNAIENGWVAPPTAEERRRAAQPEHVQEQSSIDAERRRAAAAREKREVAQLRAIDVKQLRTLVDRAIVGVPEAMARAYRNHRDRPWMLVSLREKICASLGDTQLIGGANEHAKR